MPRRPFFRLFEACNNPDRRRGDDVDYYGVVTLKLQWPFSCPMRPGSSRRSSITFELVPSRFGKPFCVLLLYMLSTYHGLKSQTCAYHWLRVASLAQCSGRGRWGCPLQLTMKCSRYPWTYKSAELSASKPMPFLELVIIAYLMDLKPNACSQSSHRCSFHVESW